ncbi:acyltransferase [Amylibacter sp.]|nr:acyltransferase [Amylibacter sp.]
MKYRAEIDGLRALAVVPVILFHAGFELFSGGFVGVDVFFVISGYLITTILIEDLENQRFSLVKFYERRARRILPALFFVMFVCIPFAWMWMLPSQMKDFSQSLVAVSLFASNVLFWLESGYFDAAAEEKPLLHTWSLAVEEQYYVLFPIFLFLAWRYGKNRVFWMIVAMASISLLLSEWGWRNKEIANFYLAPTRAWELFAGSIAAFIVQKNGVQKNNFLALLGLAAITFSIFAYDESTPFPSVYALVPVLGVVLLVLYANKETIAAKLLSTRAFVGIGLISYSAYLWHQPLFAFGRVYTFGLLTLEITAALIALTFVLAFLTYKFVETPFRIKEQISPRRIFAVSAFGLLFFSVFGFFGHLNNGFNRNFEQLNAAIGDWPYLGNLVEKNIKGLYKLNADGPIDILFFGDSHAQQLAPLATKIGELGSSVGFLSGGGCPPIPKLLSDLHPHCFDLFDRLSEVLSSESHINTIVVSGCFNCYFINQSRPVPIPGDQYNYYYLNGNERLYFREGEGQTQSLASMQEFLQRLTINYEVILVGDNPLSENFNPSVILGHAYRGDSIFFHERYPSFTINEFSVTRQELLINSQLRNVTPSKAKFVNLVEIICPNGICRSLGSDGNPIYKDGNHMRPYFVTEVVGPRLIPYLGLD